MCTECKAFGVECGGTYIRHYVLRAELQSAVCGLDATRQFFFLRPAATSLNCTCGVRIAEQFRRLSIPRVTFTRAAREPAHSNCCGPLSEKRMLDTPALKGQLNLTARTQ